MSQKRVCVIGAGVIGLSSAIRIQNEVPDVVVSIIAEKISPFTTSDGSAGFWEPHLVNIDQKENIMKWGQETFDHLLSLINSPDAGKLGAQLLSGYTFSDTKEDPFWKDQVLGYRPLNMNERKAHLAGKDGVFFTTLSIVVKYYLPWLMQKFRSKGGKIQQKRISLISEISDEFDLIVNCTGLNASDLVDDKDVVPYRGQVMRVDAPWIKHFFIEEIEDGHTYIIPCADYVVLGGTGQKGNWNTRVDEHDTQRIWSDCLRLVPSLKNARKISDWVGLRPGRGKVRLELEEIKHFVKGQNRTIMVIHNYGHAGAGITLHWGCAGEVVKLTNLAWQKLSTASRL